MNVTIYFLNWTLKIIKKNEEKQVIIKKRGITFLKF